MEEWLFAEYLHGTKKTTGHSHDKQLENKNFFGPNICTINLFHFFLQLPQLDKEFLTILTHSLPYWLAYNQNSTCPGSSHKLDGQQAVLAP